MHFFTSHGHLMQSLLLAQVVGFPIAFVVRAAIWGVRAWRGERRGRLLAAGNLCFAGAMVGFCALSARFLPLAFMTGMALLLAGAGLSVAAFRQVRRAAPAPAPLPAPVSIRASRLGRRPRAAS